MKKILSLVRFTLSSLLIAGISYIGIVYALNTASTGYQVTSGQVKDLTLADASCKRVTNNATNRFIPTRTTAEWNSFNAVAASQGVTVASCSIPTDGVCGASSYTCVEGNPYLYNAGVCGGSESWRCSGANGGYPDYCYISNACCSTQGDTCTTGTSTWSDSSQNKYSVGWCSINTGCDIRGITCNTWLSYSSCPDNNPDTYCYVVCAWNTTGTLGCDGITCIPPP